MRTTGATIVVYERPVTGSCERCRQAHDLLIPEPGSGDLNLERIAARFGWCAGCDRLVGLRCCWVGDGALCADCSTDVSMPGSSLTNASLISNALNAIASAASSLAAAEARLGELPVRDEDRARNAWEDAWLEAGALAVRADSAARVVRRHAESGSDPAADRFAALATTWNARGRAMDDRLRDVGSRIRAPSVADAPPAGASNGGPPEIPRPPAAERGRVTTLALPRTFSSHNRVVSPPPRRAPSSGSASPGGAAAAVLSASAPTPAAGAASRGDRVPETGRISPAEPLQEPKLVPVPMATPVVEASRMPEAAAVPGSTSATTGRDRQRLVGASVVVLALIGAGIVVATIERQEQGIGSDAGPSAASTVGDSASRGSGEERSTSAEPEGSAIPPVWSETAVSFDLERMGPLSADAEGVALVLGAPEIAALPTSFDRSLRLRAAGDGICVAVPPGGSSVRSLTVDVAVVGARLGTDLVITPTRVDETVTVAFDEIPGLAPGAWYRLRVAWDAGGASLEVTERDGAETVHRAPLQTSPPPSGSATGSICIEAGRAAEEADLHLDNVRVEA